MENSPPGIQTIPSGALPGGEFLLGTVAAKFSAPPKAALPSKRLARILKMKPIRRIFKSNRRSQDCSDAVWVVTILGLSTLRHRSYAGWFSNSYSHLRSFMLTGPVGKSGELSQSSLLARACLGPTRNDGSDVAGNR